ncbi:TonB-dependent receptor [Neolewinella persica]|uniref:TonB-dependent receptor n=1 Tax=Neolewinella persica TaxID=70998 RepID=UPI00036E633F|nr:TonB-dependent receptor [Neolewinella persica]
MRITLLCLFNFFCTFVFAQTTVSIYGSVIDGLTAEPLIGVTVKIGDGQIGTVTDLDGKYELTGITPGSYNISASYLGYETVTRSNVIVQSKGNDAINFELRETQTELETVVVRANPFQTSRTTPLSLQRLSPDEIKTYPGGNNDIAKVVQSLPGIQGSVAGFRNDVIIRGGAPNENVYYLDGIEIPNINHFSTQGSAGGPVGLLNVDFIEGVELASSAFDARYDNPLSGVLQFDQRVGNRRERQTNLRISASEAALTTEGPLLKKDRTESNTSYLLSVRRSYLQFLFAAIGLPIRPDYYDYQYKINHEIDEYNTVYLTGIGSIDDFSVEADDEFEPERAAQLEQVPIIKQWTTTAGLGWKRRLKNGKGLMTTTASINVLDNTFSRYTDNEAQTGLLLETASRETEQKLRYAYTRFVGDWSITGGGNLTRAVYTNTTEDLLRDQQFSTDLDFFRIGLFGQANTTVLDGKLDVSLGLRMDGNTFTNGGVNNHFLRTLSPRASLSYRLDPTGAWRLNGTVGRYFKILPYTVLGFRDATGAFANRDVDYTASNHLGLGVERRVAGFGKLSVEGFFKQYSNYAVSVVDGVSLANKGADFSILGNEDIVSSGEGRSYGAEFLYQQKLYKNFYVIAALTLYRSEFTGLDGVYRPSTWDSRQLFSLTGGYKAPRNWEISGRYRFVGQSPFAPTDVDASLETYPVFILDYDNLGSNRLENFQQLDIRIDKKWNFKALSLNVFLEVQNVLAAVAPAPPSYGLDRNETGELVTPTSLIIIPEDEGSFLPSFGLAVDF